jgi:hypothetical protein
MVMDWAAERTDSIKAVSDENDVEYDELEADILARIESGDITVSDGLAEMYWLGYGQGQAMEYSYPS